MCHKACNIKHTAPGLNHIYVNLSTYLSTYLSILYKNINIFIFICIYKYRYRSFTYIVRKQFSLRLKGGFHEPTEINKINHRCIQIGRRHLHTNRHRPMDIGAVLAADYTSYFMINWQEK